MVSMTAKSLYPATPCPLCRGKGRFGRVRELLPNFNADMVTKPQFTDRYYAESAPCANFMSVAYPDALSSIIGLDDGTVGSVADVSGVFADAAIAASDAALPPSLGAPLSAGALLSAGNFGVVEITVTAVGGAAGTGGSPGMLPGFGAPGLFCTFTPEMSASSWF